MQSVPAIVASQPKTLFQPQRREIARQLEDAGADHVADDQGDAHPEAELALRRERVSARSRHEPVPHAGG